MTDFSFECTSYHHYLCEYCDCWCHEDDPLDFNLPTDDEVNFDEDNQDFFDDGGEA